MTYKFHKIILLVFLIYFSSANAFTGKQLEDQILNARNKGGVHTIKQGVYFIDKSITIQTLGKNININFPLNTVLVGGRTTRLTKPVISFIGSDNSTTAVVIGGRGTLICEHCSNGVSASGADQGGSGINAENMYRFQVTGMKFIAGEDKDKNGDSGITTSNVKTIRLLYNEFEGWDDVGVYISGQEYGSGTDSGEWAYIYSNKFINNHVSFSSKRNFRYARVERNIFDGNFVDITAFPTGNGDSGKTINVLNNTFYHTRRNLVDTRGDFKEVNLSNNKICRPYSKVKEEAAVLIINSSSGEGKIITNGNRIDVRFFDPSTEMVKKGAKNVFTNDIILNGC